VTQASDTTAAMPWRPVTALSGVFALRMLGIFMVFPVLAVWATDLPGATPALVGLALGVYGITQAMFQIPMGMLSDRVGRRRVIVLGLVIFAAGSLLAAGAETIWGVIAGRALQGAGAIAAAITALAADLTPPHYRTRAMAVIGMSIGGAFGLSMVAGPALEGQIGVPGIFLLAGLLGFAAIAWLLLTVPGAERNNRRGGLGLDLLREPVFASLCGGVLLLHLLLTAVFLVVPASLVEATGTPVAEHWKVYLPVLLAAVVCMVPLILFSERAGRAAWLAKPIAIVLVAAGLAVMGLANSTAAALIAGLWVFFTGFTFLEAHLPARVSQAAPDDRRGAALGIYSTAQFLGAFLGGAGAGLASGLITAAQVLIAAAALGILWLLVAVRGGSGPRRG
jgi:MFS family permease